MAKFLDIIIPEYDCNIEYVKSLLNSINIQKGIDFNEIGIIYVNDKSSKLLNDELFKEYPSLDITYLKRDINGGQSAARQTGLDYSKATYVTFIDQDDILYKDLALAPVINNLKKENVDAVFTSFIRDFPELKRSELLTIKELTCLHGLFINREFLIKNNIKFHPNIRMYEDLYFCELIMNMADVRIFDYPTYIWIFRDTCQTAIYNTGSQCIIKKINDYVIAVTDMIEFLRNSGKLNQVTFLRYLFTLIILLESDLFKNTDISK
ncbi:MAG: glycosyltransferase family 2 protein, partial [Acholeplasmatales bacterium]|nr:glycosyltransferase family 2 protein [Acholeplasmatales bacterium]